MELASVASRRPAGCLQCGVMPIELYAQGDHRCLMFSDLCDEGDSENEEEEEEDEREEEKRVKLEQDLLHHQGYGHHQLI